MIEYKSVSEFASKYDAFILDIWGVIHDGEQPYPGALETMQELHRAGKEIIFLSNAPRRAEKVKKALAKFGITEDLYNQAVSSGEVAYQYFAKKAPGKYYYIGPEKDADLLDGLNYKAVASASEAEFALVTGFDKDDSTLEEKLPQINEAFLNGLKMYCVNPDLIVVRQNGAKLLCAGVIGEFYRGGGGITEFIGKPYPSVYEYVLGQLTTKDKSRIAAIGDSLITDIRGANNVGIDSILVLGGILEAENKPLPNLIKETQAEPIATIPKFSW